MASGQNFPVSEYYRDHILDAETISRAGGWWTAVLLISDPNTKKPFLAMYRWQLDGNTWKTRKSINFKSRKQLDAVMAVVKRLSDRIVEETDV